MEDTKRIIEINGIKMEIDLRTAKRVDNFQVGDSVKLLIKEYNDSFKSWPAVIVGFDEFKERPTIVVAYVKNNYSTPELLFAYINKDSKDYELAPLQDFEMKLSFDEIQKKFDHKIEESEKALQKLKTEKTWFNETYKKFFGKFVDFGQDCSEGQS